MMITDERKREFYQALIDKNSVYDGIFYVGVTTTGVLCRPTCHARKPRFENCAFFLTIEEALLASFRPCLRCRPLSHPHHVSALVGTLVEAVEKHPEKRWKNRDFEALSIHASTARRQFQKRFDMTFVAYARARRMGLAMKHIRKGETVINTQLTTGYESSSGFRDAFSKIMGSTPTRFNPQNLLQASWLDTCLGPMLAVADEKELYLLEFVDRRGLEREIERLRSRTHAAIIPGCTEPIKQIEGEIQAYLKGHLKIFQTPIHLLGSPFQKQVWETLIKIPYGVTRSYADQASTLGRPSAYRAVAGANGANQLAIIIPCHRIINTNGHLGGYGGGLARKQWLLDHERKRI